MPAKKARLQPCKVVLIGSGNVASCVGAALKQAGHSIAQVYSKTPHAAALLGKKLTTSYTSRLDQLFPGADIYLIAVKDDALPLVARRLRITSGIVAHTSGTTDSAILKQCAPAYGVFYPLQTFSKGRKINLTHAPFCIEANTKKAEQVLKQLARTISNNVHIISSEQRKILHLAAVFTSNFSNHMYAIARAILEKNKLPFKLLGPLMEETAAKARMYPPHEVQTGPAKRKDKKIMREHLKLLSKDKALQHLYSLISKHIMQFPG